MADNTKIEWCDHTFNPWEGCTKVSPGCDHCYAATRNARFNGAAVNWGPGAPRRRTSAANWAKPRAWNRNAEAFAKIHGRKQRVFCASLADVFDNEVDPAWRLDLFNLIDETQMLDWLLLTKRIGNVAAMLAELGRECLPVNVWLGATVINQDEADRDIPKLIAAPATIRFLSCEPLLGPVDLRRFMWPVCKSMPSKYRSWSEAEDAGELTYKRQSLVSAAAVFLDWVICGGESGPGARPMHPDWARSLRDQCAAAGVPFHFKQCGEWHAFTSADLEDLNGKPMPATTVVFEREGKTGLAVNMWRIGKARAGRLLDGREHNAFPGSN